MLHRGVRDFERAARSRNTYVFQRPFEAELGSVFKLWQVHEHCADSHVGHQGREHFWIAQEPLLQSFQPVDPVGQDDHHRVVSVLRIYVTMVIENTPRCRDPKGNLLLYAVVTTVYILGTVFRRRRTCTRRSCSISKSRSCATFLLLQSSWWTR